MEKKKKLKQFLAIYLASPNGKGAKRWAKLDRKAAAELEKAGVHGWMTWVTHHESRIVDGGAPLGKTKRIDARGVSGTRNQITAYTIVEAESHQAAARMFLKHPHFTIFPGDSIEVMECLPVPGMD